MAKTNARKPHTDFDDRSSRLGSFCPDWSRCSGFGTPRPPFLSSWQEGNIGVENLMSEADGVWDCRSEIPFYLRISCCSQTTNFLAECSPRFRGSRSSSRRRLSTSAASTLLLIVLCVSNDERPYRMPADLTPTSAR